MSPIMDLSLQNSLFISFEGGRTKGYSQNCDLAVSEIKVLFSAPWHRVHFF